MSDLLPGQAAPSPVETVDWDEFDGAVRAAFFAVKRALSVQRPEVCRRAVTEDLWEQLRAQVAVLQHDGCVDLQDRIDVTEIKHGDVDVDGPLHRVTARLMVSGMECVVRQATQEVVTGLREQSEWIEDWTLERSFDPALVEESTNAKCPNCGAPLSLDADGRCAFCQASVPGAKTDWLVSAISRPPAVDIDRYTDTQATIEAGKVVVDALAAGAAEHPWTGSDPAPPQVGPGVDSGLAAIRAHDPAFSAPDLVVAGREVFLRLEDARNRLRPEDVRPVLGDALYARELTRARQVAAGGRNEVRAYLDISDVTLVGASCDGTRDRLVVRVSAVSARSVVDLRTGDLLEGSAVTHPWAEDLVFERAATATTNALAGFLAGRCPACGQEAAVTDDGRCAYCGQHVTGGEKDWVLVDVKPVESSPAAGGSPG